MAWATPAFFRTRPKDLAAFDVWAVRLRHGDADVAKLNQAISHTSGGRIAQAFALNEQSVNTQRSIHLQAVALWLLAGLLALTGALILSQLLLRQSFLEAVEFADLRALGMSRPQLWGVGMARAALTGVVGAAVAVGVALLLSPLTPIGLARIAEPHPGFAADGGALLVGAAATFGLVVVTAAWPTWRAARLALVARLAPTGNGRRVSPVVSAAARSGAPATVTAGVRLALEPGEGRTAVPVRSTITGAAVAVAALVTALAFSASLSHLLATPRLYGAPWDARVENVGDGGVAGAVAVLKKDRRVATLAQGYTGFPVTIGHRRVDGIALESVRGDSLMPTPVRGRVPTAPDEIMLGIICKLTWSLPGKKKKPQT